MPGIFGIRLRRTCQDAVGRAHVLSRDLCLFDWQSSKMLEADPGKVYLGVAWNDFDTIARGADSCSREDVFCVLEGRIVRTREDCDAGSLISSGRHAEAAILAYQRFGEDFPSRLEGPFALILYDRNRGILLGATERHGLSPLYRYEGDEAVFFCSLLGPMAGSGFFDATIDTGAAATFLGHHHLFYRQSLLHGVVLQDPATVVKVDAGAQCTQTRYWHYGFMGPRGDISYRRRIDDLCDTLLCATDRIIAPGERLYTGLSGGFDSRLVTGLALNRGEKPIAWTFGFDGAADLEVSKAICNHCGLTRLAYIPDPSHVLKHIESFFSLINGCGPLVHAFWLERSHDLRGQADLYLNGYRGGVLLGDAIVDLGLQHRLLHWRGRLGVGPKLVSPNLEDAQDSEAMSDFYLALSHRAHPGVALWTVTPEPPLAEMLRDALGGVLDPVDPEYRIEQWTEEFGGGRHFTLLGIIADRHFYADASHFYDYDVRDRCFTLPPRSRRGRRAYIDVIKRLIPELARFPYANTGLPATSPSWLVQGVKISRRLVGRRTVPSSGASPVGWLTGPPVRDFCGDILHSQLSRGRSWWNGEAVAASFDACQSGTGDMAAELWNAVALELFARRWLDERKPSVREGGRP